jgi:hypothetical protein
MNKQVWMDVHHYSPPSAGEKMEEETNESPWYYRIYYFLYINIISKLVSI